MVEEVIKLAFAVLGVVLVPLSAVIAQRVMTKLGLQVGAEQDAKLRAITQAAIREAEERATGAAKRGLPVAADDKLEMAIGRVLDMVPGVSRAEADAVVHQELPKVRAALAGVLTSVRTAATTGPTT